MQRLGLRIAIEPSGQGPTRWQLELKNLFNQMIIFISMGKS